jgi:hypothetical protein
MIDNYSFKKLPVVELTYLLSSVQKWAVYSCLVRSLLYEVEVLTVWCLYAKKIKVAGSFETLLPVATFHGVTSVKIIILISSIHIITIILPILLSFSLSCLHYCLSHRFLSSFTNHHTLT